MLVQPKLSYPGVYVVEVPPPPGGIPDIPTGIAAFVGRARMGPTDQPIMVNSYGDFETQFGGLWAYSPLSYSVKQFFDNGGSQAYIVRICATEDAINALGDAIGYAPDPKSKTPKTYAESLGDQIVLVTPNPDGQTGQHDANSDGLARINVAATADGQKPGNPPDKGFQLLAANPGDWGNALQVEIDRNGITDSVAAAFGVPAASLFNLTVHYEGGSERIANVSIDPGAGAQRIDHALSTSMSVRHASDDASITQAAGADILAITQLHQVTYRDPKKIKTQKDYLAQLPTGDGGDDGYYLSLTGLYTGDAANQRGLYQLDKIDIFNLLIIPRDRFLAVPMPLDFAAIFNYVDKRRAFWLLDTPADKLADWDGKILRGQPGIDTLISDTFDNPGDLGRNAAVFYPDVLFPDPLLGLRPKQFGPAGAVAGIFARTDQTRGVWKAPAGTGATVTGLVGLTAKLDDDKNGTANLAAINCFREFPPTGTVLWGSRTLRGAQALADAFRYVPVRRLSLYIYESLRRGLQWAVFEPNDESLWSTIRDRVDDFMTGLMRQGAFQGTTKSDAFYVRCGLGSTMTANDITNGICNVQVGFAPVKPAEFIVLYFEQMTADSQG